MWELNCLGDLFFSLPPLWSEAPLPRSCLPVFPSQELSQPPESPYLCLTLLALLAVCLGRNLMRNGNKSTKHKSGWAFALSPDLLIYPEASCFQSHTILTKVKMWEAVVKLTLLDCPRNSTQGVFIFIFLNSEPGFYYCCCLDLDWKVVIVKLSCSFLFHYYYCCSFIVVVISYF